jgi:hypothetical protein
MVAAIIFNIENEKDYLKFILLATSLLLGGYLLKPDSIIALIILMVNTGINLIFLEVEITD